MLSQRVEADEVVMDLQVQLKRSKGALAGEACGEEVGEAGKMQAKTQACCC